MLKILFADDGSEASLRAARRLSAMAQWWTVDEMCVVNVQPAPSGLGEPFSFELEQRAEGLARMLGTGVVDASLELFRGRYASVTSSVVLGDAAVEIVSTAAQRESTLIAVGSHGASSPIGFPIGSVTMKVLHLAGCGVLVFPAHQTAASSPYGPPQRPLRILLPVDGSAGSLAAVREVVRVAPSFTAPPEIHLLTVYDRTPLDEEIGAMVSADALADYERNHLEEALRPARGLLASTVLRVIEHTEMGPTALRIQSVAQDQACDMVCIGMHGHGTLRDKLLGSTTSKLLHVSALPILAVPSRE